MIIIDRNITALEGVFKAGQNVECALSESACNDLIKRGWAHKSQAKNVADQDDAQTDDAQSNEGDNTESQQQQPENGESEGDQSEEESTKAEEPSDEPEETEEVVIDSLKELDQALEQPAKTSGTSRKRGK